MKNKLQITALISSIILCIISIFIACITIEVSWIDLQMFGTASAIVFGTAAIVLPMSFN